jgi:hypothetical protein
VSASDLAVSSRVRESNEYAAKFVAANASRDLEQYFRQVEQVAASDELRELLAAVQADEALTEHLAAIADPSASAARKQHAQAALFAHEAQHNLQRYVDELMTRRPDLRASSWFTTDALGSHLADIFDVPPKDNPEGKNFAGRAYFTGFDADIPPKDITWPAPRRLSDIHLSPVFLSTATKTWKVAVSAPVFADDSRERFLGVVAVTVEMGQFANSLREASQGANSKATRSDSRQFAVLLADRRREGQAVILQHPLFNELPRNVSRAEFNQVRYQVRLDDPALASLRGGGSSPTHVASYEDPLGQHPAGAHLRKEWIAATAMVPVPRSSRASNESQDRKESGLFVLVQEDRRAAIAPVHALGKRLERHALYAFAGVIAVIVATWLLVVRMLSTAEAAMIQESSASRATPTPQHSAETMPAK